MNAQNVVGVLTALTPSALGIDDGEATRLVPFGIVRAYAILESLIEYSGNVLS